MNGQGRDYRTTDLGTSDHGLFSRERTQRGTDGLAATILNPLPTSSSQSHRARRKILAAREDSDEQQCKERQAVVVMSKNGCIIARLAVDARTFCKVLSCLNAGDFEDGVQDEAGRWVNTSNDWTRREAAADKDDKAFALFHGECIYPNGQFAALAGFLAGTTSSIALSALSVRGYLQIRRRMKRFGKVSGEKVSLSAVEDALAGGIPAIWFARRGRHPHASRREQRRSAHRPDQRTEAHAR